MSKKKMLWSVAMAVGVVAAASQGPATAQNRPQPERELLGIRLGRPILDVMKRFERPSEVQTVALFAGGDQLPGVGGGGGGGAMGGMMPGLGGGGMMPGMGSGGMMPGMGSGGMMPGMGSGGMMPGMGSGGMMPGMGGGSSPYGGGSSGAGMMPRPGGSGGMMGGGGSPYGGGGSGMGMMPRPGAGGAGGMFGGGSPCGGSSGGGIPSLPPAGGGSSGGSFPGLMGPGMGGGADMGFPGGGGGVNMPEYSNAILWIYKRPKNVRLEFLFNEDGRVAQISAAAPAGTPFPAAKTSKGVTLGSSLNRVIAAYGYPERHRMLPGNRFYEAYYTKNHHAAFTFDTEKDMQCVRITIALAD